MSEPKWTKGPWHWEVEDGSFMGLYRPDGPLGVDSFVMWAQICTACQERGNRCTAPNDANAHLIAAAPELYEALENVVKFQEWIVLRPPKPDTVYGRAVRVLAKARGEGGE